jgi:hypothetical protein
MAARSNVSHPSLIEDDEEGGGDFLDGLAKKFEADFVETGVSWEEAEEGEEDEDIGLFKGFGEATETGKEAQPQCKPKENDIQTLVMLEIYKKLRGRGAHGDEEDLDLGVDETGGLGITTGRRGVCKAIKNYHTMRKGIHRYPKKIIACFIDRMMELLGASPGQVWHLADVNKKINWGRYKSYQRAHFMLAHIFTLLDEGKNIEAQALCVQGMKCFHQAALDWGDFRSA